jgi:DNA polymerase I-like protein with 3'-5' exonuclease and polymerase domains
MPIQDDDDAGINDFLEALDSTTPVTTKAEPKAEVRRPTIDDDDGDDAVAFLENSGLKRDLSVPNPEKPWMRHHKFTLVKSVEEVNRIVDECIAKGSCSLDLETQGLDNRIVYDQDGKPRTIHQIVGFCISYDGIEGFYIPIRHKPSDGGPGLNVEPVAEVEKAITRLCQAAIPEGTPEAIAKDHLSWEGVAKLVIYFWNAQFDQEFLYPVTGIDWWHPNSFEDGMLACFTKYAGDKGIGLKVKAKQLLRDPDGNIYEMIELKELFQRGMRIQFDLLSPDEPGVLRYTGSDGICTYKLCKLPELVPLCLKEYRSTYRLEKQTTGVLRVMERNRVRVNRAQIMRLLEKHQAERTALLDKIMKFAKAKGVNLDPNSPKQLGEFLFGTGDKALDITPKPEKNDASQQYKTDGETLEGLAEAENAPSILKDIVTYRGYEKLIGTYLTGLAQNPDSNDELRFCFKQTGAATGRLSAPGGDPSQGHSGIPIHGIPSGSDLRRVFEARNGYVFVKCDYAGEELRIAANVSGETVWVKEFLEGTGDLHTITAKAFFGKQEVTKEERNQGKTANFALLYGGGPKSIIRATGCNEMEARRRKQAFDKAVPIFAKWIKSQHAIVKKELGVRTAFGRWLSIPDANSIDGAIRAACERHSVNFQIQGAGADIMKISMVLLHKFFHKKGWLKNGGDDSIRMLLTVHDEIVFEISYARVAEAIPLIVNIMESPWKLPKTAWKVPLVVEPLIGWNWSSGFKVERHKKGHALGKDEFLMNGFAYSITRKPGKNESPDTGEVVDGKVFRFAEMPPWLAGFKAEQADQVVVAVSGTDAAPETTPVKLEAGKQPDMPSAEQLTPEVEITASNDVLTFGINQLNMHTAQQVFGIVWSALEKSGPILHLTDIVGETIVPPSLNLRVNQEELMYGLRDANLLQDDSN